MTYDSYPNLTTMITAAPVYVLRISVYENGELYDWKNYSGQELSSLTDTIRDLWNPPYNSDMYFEFDCEDSDDDPPQCYLYCGIGEDNRVAFPEELLLKTVSSGFGKTYRLVGDQIPIQPEQYGLSPWPADVKVKFEII